MSAIRKLAAEAANNGLLAPELAAGISRLKSAKTQGLRTGNWLSQRQAQALLSAPDITTLRGLRDRAILAVLLGWPLHQWWFSNCFAARARTILRTAGVRSIPLPA